MSSRPHWILKTLFSFLVCLPLSVIAAERIQVSRFASSGNYSSALTYGYTREAKGVGPYLSDSGFKTFKQSGGGCSSLLQEYQDFPLKKMVEVGYLTETQAKAYANLGSELHPTQMTFYTKTESDEKPEYTHGGLFVRPPIQEGRILATLYSVSSFRLNHLDGAMIHVPIPLELEPKWKPVLDANLPKAKRMFMWEFGRAAQDGPGEIDDLLRAATLGCLNDIFSYGWAMVADFNEIAARGHVLIHAKDRKHIIAYKRRFPSVQVITHPLDDNDAAFIVPVTLLVEQYKPEMLSPTLMKLIAATEGKINATQAVMVLNFLKRFRWEELNMGYIGVKENRYPIVFSPSTSGAMQVTAVLDGILNELGVPQEYVKNIMRAFSSVEQNFLVNTPGKYVDVTEPGISSAYYRPRKAQEISNLDPIEAKNNPYYIASVLTGIYRHFLEMRLGKFDAQTKIPEEFMFRLDKLMEEDGIKFGITTLDPELSLYIQALEPSEVVTHKNPVPPGGIPKAETLDPEFAFLTRDIGKTYYMHFFTIAQIHRLGAILQGIPGHNGPAAIAKSSRWQMFYDTANPEIF